ncbi:AarF/UbiB family protein [Propionivibrio sp.]|uniref:AarF/UbiB family protein n=1 Tax=Propionivibrio sp. TaxID=2212460 RepID=UPI0026204546|nr:AarF/UbiB family protein [Propionivibrio sp.]
MAIPSGWAVVAQPASPAPESIVDRLRRRAEETPNLIAYVHGWSQGQVSQVTWGEFWRDCQSLAIVLREEGLESGECVGILAPSQYAWELVHLATLLAGCAVVGLDPYDQSERVLNIATQSGIRALWLDGPELAVKHSELLSLPLKFLAYFGPAVADEPGKTLEEMTTRRRGKSWARPLPSPHSLATIVYTSGTTGEPKGICYTQYQIVLACRAILDAFPEIQPGMKTLCWLPLVHLFQRILDLCTLMAGGTVHFVEQPTQVMDLLPKIQPDVFVSVPRFYEKLHAGIMKSIRGEPTFLRWFLHAALAEGRYYASLRRRRSPWRFFLLPLQKIVDTVVLRRFRQAMGGEIKFMISGSAPLSLHLLEFFHGLGLLILEAYGTSENVIPIASNRVQHFRLGSAGLPLPPNEVTIGNDGQVLVKGPGLFAGYLNGPSGETPFQEGYYATGDLAQMDADGFLYLVGRKSDIFKTSRGQRIAPLPIEDALRAAPFVDQAIVLGSGRQWPAALLTLDLAAVAAQMSHTAGRAVDIHGDGLLPEIREFIVAGIKRCLDSIPTFRRPVGFLILNKGFSVIDGEITANLKLKRREIEDKYAELFERLYKEIDDGGDYEPRMWFLTTADLRMEEFAFLPILAKVQSHLLLRLAVIGKILAEVGWALFRYRASLALRPLTAEAAREDLAHRLGKIFVEDVGPLKGPLMKIGQSLSYMSAGLPPSFRRTIRVLQQISSPVAAESMAAVIERDLGLPISELFSEWNEKPMASASMGQVHLARLPDGRRVAVKVRYPGVPQIVRTDLAALRALLPLLRYLTGVRNLHEVFARFRGLVETEMDFRREGEYQQTIRSLFPNEPDILIPEVFRENCSESVLTMEYIDGQRFDEFRLTASQAERNRAGLAIWHFVARSVYRHGIFHADPHPGNFLFTDGKVCILDFGFCERWNDNYVELLRRQTVAAMDDDLVQFIAANEKLGLNRSPNVFDHQALLTSYRSTIYRAWLDDRPFRFTPEYAQEVMDALVKHQLHQENIYVPPSSLALSRLFWGLYCVLGELQAEGNWHRLIVPYLREPKADEAQVPRHTGTIALIA